jgi:hypothetical protein
MAPDEA